MVIEGRSTAEVWMAALSYLVEQKKQEISPVVMKIELPSGQHIRNTSAEIIVGEYLKTRGLPSIETTSNTIFPSNLNGNDGTPVYDRYDKIWKYVRKEPRNRRGTYFRRLTAYGDSKHNSQPRFNQLEHIVNTFNGIEGQRQPVHRRSALMACIFDPYQDHTPQPMLGFPCLQQVCFIPSATELSMNAVYAMQYLDSRAYGNYEGLINLGRFMAGQMGLTFSHLNCVVSVLALQKMSKVEAKLILRKYQQLAMK